MDKLNHLAADGFVKNWTAFTNKKATLKKVAFLFANAVRFSAKTVGSQTI